ncbi:protein DENND6B [Drosophila willistoni]|uniref:protein DENND6B n=1 Tax=Drosophila willistoni TaxID=7260 RepID=UPI00017D9D4C|nr:protein DENND6B [Drosophila willistoni]
MNTERQFKESTTSDHRHPADMATTTATARVNPREKQPAEDLESNSNINNPNTSSLNDNATNDWIHFSQWIHCFCVVTFDLNLGQALEHVYPPQFVPSDQEVSNICYMAFPDSNSGCMGDTKFHMRLRALSKPRAYAPITQYNGDCAPAMRQDASHFWGFVYFRQKRDANLPRGYFQKSFIIITRLPFFNLYYDMLSQLAPRYFDEGMDVIMRASEQINNHWPGLRVGHMLNLPLLGYNYQITIPRAQSSSRSSSKSSSLSHIEQQSNNKSSSAEVATMMTIILPSVNEIDLFRSLSMVLEQIYTLWELVITAEPIVVVATSPSDCSHMVQSLLALIAPLEYCAEARPYFTIHDSEFREFTHDCSNKTGPPACILGVTNPFFIKLLKDWPHMLRLVDNQQQLLQLQFQFHKNSRNASSSLMKTTSTSAHNILNGGEITSSSTSASTSGLLTKYKPYLKKDKTLIKKVLLGMKTKRPEHVQTALIRRHLLELTQSFMIPLERYMATLMPLQKDISPFKSAPNASSFKLDDFLATVELAGPQLTSPVKGDWKGLYKRFFRSPNFRGWYESRHRELQLTLQDLQLQALSEANLEHWAHDKQEVEIIDMILKLKQKLNLYSDNNAQGIEGISWLSTANGSGAGAVAGGAPPFSGNSTQQQIRAQIECMKSLLPPDLKNVVNL